jgi:hypothetical protein
MTRDELYRYFGPRLIDALAQVMLDEINLLRTKAGLSLRTEQQAIDAIANKLTSIQKYDWMIEQDKMAGTYNGN